jgi:4-amino-4-deoxy-L-arabinose transferase-like glycosyltransferase
MCALIAFLNAASWSILSPPFQIPDETDHFAYVQQLAEAHRLPTGSGTSYSPEEEAAIEGLRQQQVRFNPSERTISSRAQQRQLEHDLARPLSRRGPGKVGVAGSEPPLYYALETIPYELASSGSLLDRLALMRAFSALFGALTALFSFMFIREVLPRVPWAWTVGGLGVALAPLLGFMSGAVNPDGLLYAVSAALFYQVARCFRRGLTPRAGLAIGITVVVGLLTKLNFLGLVPGVVLALLIVAWRERAGSRRNVVRGLAVALAPVAILAIAYAALASSTGHSVSFTSSKASELTKGPGTVASALSYTWQFYLPHLPFMRDYFPGLSTWRQLWFNGLVGLYGWADTVFPNWLYSVALVPGGIGLLLLLRALFLERLQVRSHLVEGVVYATMAVGVMTLVGVTSYFSDVLERSGPYWEPRYLMPMIALAGVALALTARGAGRRWGPVIGALVVVLILGHDIFSQLLVVSRYYV